MGSDKELQAIEEMIRRLNVPQPVQKSPTDEGQEQKAEPEHQGVSEAELTAVVNMVELLQKENQEEISSQTVEEVFRKFESISERLSKLENDPRPSPKNKPSAAQADRPSREAARCSI